MDWIVWSTYNYIESVDFLEVRNISTIEYLELSIVFLPCSLRSFKTLGLEQHGANRK